MATHYRHSVNTRRWRLLETILELLTTWIELWTEFWYGTEPSQPAHSDQDHGATPRWADQLHDIDITAVHDTLSSDVGRYEQLIHANVICGDPELTDVIPTIPTAAQLLAHAVSLDGGRLAGDLLDQLPGA